MSSPLLWVGPFVLDLRRMSLRGPSGVIAVRRKSFDVLRYLAEHAGRLVPKDELINGVWPNVTVGDNSLTQCISELRRALGTSSREIIKTIPRRGYLIDVAVPTGGEAAPRSGRHRVSLGRPLLDRPSIAVLPFINLDTGAKYDYLADGMTEGITTELSRFSELLVIAQNSSSRYKGRAVDVRQIGRELRVRYVVEGGVRRSGPKVKITTQLIDVRTRANLWADRYERRVEDLFTAQSEVVRAIVSMLVSHLNRAAIERTLSKPPSAWAAHDYYMKAASTLASFWRSSRVDALYETRRLLERSLAIDPEHARALVMLSNTHVLTWTQPLDADFLKPVALEAAYQFARKAVQSDANLPQAHAQLGWVLSRRAEHDLAISEFEKAVILNPNFTDYRFGAALVYAGASRRAVQKLNAHMRLDPFYPPTAPAFLGLAHHMLKQYSTALAPLHECAIRAPNFRPVHIWLAATYARMGLMRQAAAEVAEVLRIEPNYTIRGTSKRIMRFKNANDALHLFNGLRMAGLPE